MGKFGTSKKDAGAGDGGLFLRLKDGESAQGILRGDTHEFNSKWVGGKSIECGPDEGSFRFRINFVVRENGAMVAKVFEQGWRVYESLKGLEETGYNLDETTVRIARTGSTKDDTVYSVTPVPDGQLKGQALQMLEAVELKDLKGKKDETKMLDKEYNVGADAKYTTDTIPF